MEMNLIGSHLTRTAECLICCDSLTDMDGLRADSTGSNGMLRNEFSTAIDIASFAGPRCERATDSEAPVACAFSF